MHLNVYLKSLKFSDFVEKSFNENFSIFLKNPGVYYNSKLK
jgi:hypothetical protein